jgi:ferredoxin
MAEVEVTLEREDLEGVVPVGTYLADAMRRLGIKDMEPCDQIQDVHECAVTVTKGEDLLSPLTSVESEHFAAEGRKSGERLACQAKIEKPGEIAVMTKEKEKKAEQKEPESSRDEYRKEFADLPLEKKIADLVKLEAITVGETFSFIVNSPMKVFEKVGDVMAEFGMKLETEAKKAQRPAEHQEASENGGTKSEKGRSKAHKKAD